MTPVSSLLWFYHGDQKFLLLCCLRLVVWHAMLDVVTNAEYSIIYVIEDYETALGSRPMVGMRRNPTSHLMYR